jgi:hypothetical protein
MESAARCAIISRTGASTVRMGHGSCVQDALECVRSAVDLTIRFQSYGWWTPDYQHFDDFKVIAGP